MIVVKTYWKEKSLNSKIKIIICLADKKKYITFAIANEK